MYWTNLYPTKRIVYCNRFSLHSAHQLILVIAAGYYYDTLPILYSLVKLGLEISHFKG